MRSNLSNEIFKNALFQKTALHYAAEENHDSVVTYLMDSGAKFTQDGSKLYFTSFAFKRENLKAARAIVYNKR